MQHLEGKFKGSGNFNLYYQCWLPSEEPAAILLVIHGMSEHSGRYADFAGYFTNKGYAVYALDHRGHGKSPGLRGYVDKFSDFVDDIDAFLRVIRDRHVNTKIFLFGHSIGGTIAFSYCLSHQEKLNGLILSGATLKAGESVSPVLIITGRLLSLILPRMGIYSIDKSAISRNNAIIQAYRDDPLVYHGKIRTRLGIEIIKSMRKSLARAKEIHLPLLILYGTADRLSDPAGSVELYERAGSQDKTLKPYEDFYHEIFNEPGSEQVLSDIEIWLHNHL